MYYKIQPFECATHVTTCYVSIINFNAQTIESNPSPL